MCNKYKIWSHTIHDHNITSDHSFIIITIKVLDFLLIINIINILLLYLLILLQYQLHSCIQMITLYINLLFTLCSLDHGRTTGKFLAKQFRCF